LRTLARKRDEAIHVACFGNCKLDIGLGVRTDKSVSPSALRLAAVREIF
jgi:hypothetical protein